MNDICPANAWNAGVFWMNVKAAIHIAEAQLGERLTDEVHDRVEQMILREWLDYMATAGTA